MADRYFTANGFYDNSRAAAERDSEGALAGAGTDQYRRDDPQFPAAARDVAG